jgi:hypothetical protein
MRIFLVERLRDYRDLRRDGASSRELFAHDDITAVLFCIRFPVEIRAGLHPVKPMCYARPPCKLTRIDSTSSDSTTRTRVSCRHESPTTTS